MLQKTIAYLPLTICTGRKEETESYVLKKVTAKKQDLPTSIVKTSLQLNMK
jgi:hypothetical protein